MSGGPAAAYHFLPWARYGVLAGISRSGAVANQLPQDTLGRSSTGLPARADLPIKLRVNGAATDEIDVPLRLYGPGDVAGIDPREIIRTEPRHLTTDFPPHLFPFVEFDRPDFPWLFTPARANQDQRLRPWLVLAVVRKAQVTLSTDPRRPLPVLECPVSELPDLRESWAWAHAQYSGSVGTGATLDGAGGLLGTRPHQTVSRLLCPRKLEPRRGGADTSYYACLVPAFEGGRKAGLGEPLLAADETALSDAWNVTATDPVALPVYYHWEFSTGEEGNFEELVERLRVLEQLPDSAPGLMDVSQSGAGLPKVPGATLGVESALRSPSTKSLGWPAGLSRTFPQFQEDMRRVLETPLRPGSTPPAVAPPIYGRWQAAGEGSRGSTPLAPGAAPPWLRHLNLDPRYRAAASLGAQIVQRQQEQLVDASWQQAGEAQAANQWLRQKELARAVSESIHEKRLGALSPATLQQIASPVAIPSDTATRSLVSPSIAIDASPVTPPPPALADALVSAPFRRIARPLGTLARPAATTAVATPTTTTGPTVPALKPLAEQFTVFLKSATSGSLVVAPPPGVTAGAIKASGLPREAIATPSLLVEAAVAPTLRMTSASITFTADDGKASLLALLDPQVTFAAEAQTRIETATATDVAPRLDPLAPVLMTPSFPQPMYEPLRELFQEMLLPRLEKIPQNTLTALLPNPAFIEAYMVGLNDELARELLWREFPTELRGTAFRQFWDPSGRLGANPTPEDRDRLLDLPAIDQWQGALGANLPASRGASLLLLLIRGDLLVRYPNALIFAARAAWSTANGQPVAPAVLPEAGVPQWPVLRLTPAPGTTLLGFDLSASAPAGPAGVAQPPGDPGWFFVFQEHPTEPRFGLDTGDQALTAWRDLSWPHVRTRDGGGYVAVSTSTPALVGTPERQPSSKDLAVIWGRNAAHMAYITLRTAYRLEIHAGYWFPRDQAR